jgi:hypothetical protein
MPVIEDHIAFRLGIMPDNSCDRAQRTLNPDATIIGISAHDRALLMLGQIHIFTQVESTCGIPPAPILAAAAAVDFVVSTNSREQRFPS